MLTERLSTATRCLWRSVSEGARNVLTLRERYRAMMDAREARGITLLREWLSPMQQAQFDAAKSFDVVGCDTGRRYRIHYGTVTNVHQIDEAGQPVIPSAGCDTKRVYAGKPCKPAALSLFSGGFPAASGLSKASKRHGVALRTPAHGPGFWPSVQRQRQATGPAARSNPDKEKPRAMTRPQRIQRKRAQRHRRCGSLACCCELRVGTLGAQVSGGLAARLELRPIPAPTP